MNGITSCAGCKQYLGGGHCRINMEKECAEGGGFELYEPKEWGGVNDGRSANVYEENH